MLLIIAVVSAIIIFWFFGWGKSNESSIEIWDWAQVNDLNNSVDQSSKVETKVDQSSKTEIKQKVDNTEVLKAVNALKEELKK